MKGADIYEHIDKFVEGKNVEYTYVGRHKCDFKNTKVVPPLSGKDLGDELKNHDVYITGTRSDPGPNHIIEAITSGLPTYAYSPGGGACEFVGKDFIFETVHDLDDLLLNDQFVTNDNIFSSWEDCVEKYYKVIQEIL
jgi:hypothetical protein